MKEKIGIIGVGKMGEALVRGLLQAGMSARQISGTTSHAKSAAVVAKKFSIVCESSNENLIERCDVIVLAVKPQRAQQVLKEHSKKIRKSQILISICASVTSAQLRQWSGGRCAIVRAMPNTPCLIGEGMTVLAKEIQTKETSSHRGLRIARQLFETLGKVAEVDENLMDGATGLSGCGPAYVYLILEALSEAGVKVGLPRDLATLLAAQTLVGASKMVLERGTHPAALKDEVTTPAGCTIDGLMALEEGRLRVTLIRAVLAAARRSAKLAAL